MDYKNSDMITIKNESVLNVSPRIIVIGASLAGLSAAVELLSFGCYVDIYDQSSNIAAHLDGVSMKEGIVTASNRFVSSEKINLVKKLISLCEWPKSLSNVEQDSRNNNNNNHPLTIPPALLAKRLLFFLLKMPSQYVHIHQGKHTIKLIRTPKNQVIGVRTHDKLTQVASNSFADAIVVGCTYPELWSECGTEIDTKTCQLISSSSNSRSYVHGIYIASDIYDLYEASWQGYCAGNAAAKIYPLRFAQGLKMRRKIPQHVNFLDHNNILHRSALHPIKWTKLQLANKMRLNQYSYRFSFALPHKMDQIGLFTGQFIAVKAKSETGKIMIRYYSPITRNSHYGSFDILVRIFDGKLPPNCMQYVLRNLKIGESLEFKGPCGGFCYHRNRFKAVGLIAGGHGITPMLQILRSVYNHPEDETNISLLYGAAEEKEILGAEELLYHASSRSNIRVHVVLEHPPPKWTMGTGFITPFTISQYMPPPETGVVIVLCGPPKMMQIMTKYLLMLGYTKEMIFDFLKPPQEAFQRRIPPSLIQSKL